MTEREIFEAAIDLPDAPSRSAYLDQVCGADPVLRAKVLGLIDSHEQAGSFLAAPLVTPPDTEQSETLAFAHNPEVEMPKHDPHSSNSELNEEALAFLAPPGRPDSLGRLGHYEVLQILGHGAFGIVFRAFDEVLQRVVALKMLAPQIAATSPARKRFLREARSSAQVRHENVVQIYAVEEQPLPFLVMEFIPGETLQARLDRTGPVDVAEVLRTGRQIAEGLAAAHATDLIHRDIKPGNVLLEGGQHRVRITDFGLARAADDASISQSGIIAGTPMYMAPEQAQGEHIDHRADLFSLGTVLYQMVTGRLPFRAHSTLGVLKRVAEDTPRPIREIIPETPQWLCDIITKLHAKNPADRFQSARQVADLLVEYETQLKVAKDPQHLPAFTSGLTRPSGERGRALAFVGVACAVIVALAVYALTRPDRSTSDARTTPTPPVNPTGLASAPNLEDDRRAALYVLSIGGSVRVNGTDEFLGTVEQLPKTPFALTGVHLRDNTKVTDEGLSSFQGCRNVRHLDLAVTKVTDAGLAHFKDCTQLSTLDLFSTSMGDAGLAHFKDCPMTHLSLRSTRVTDATAAAFGHYTDLETLGIAHTLVTEAGVAHFRNCKKLKHLDLDVLPINDAALAHFVGCKNLEILHLGGTQVTDLGVAWLKECKGLRDLLLRGTPVTAVAVQDLKASLPQCRIEWTGGVIVPRAAALTDAEVQRIAALPAAEQVEAVRAELRKRNPEFDGDLTPMIEGGDIVGLEFSTLEVADITPLRSLTKLKTLVCAGQEGNGKLADLSPLKGLPLTALDCNNNPVADLTPVKGLPLKALHVQHTRVANLAPLTGLPLEHVNCSHTLVADLMPLKGMKLLTLYLDATQVTDLTPLTGMPLRLLNLRNLTLQPKRDGDVLRGLDQLEEINSEPPADFLKKLDGQGV